MPEVFAGNFKRHAAPGESHINGFSDVGSIPTGSTNIITVRTYKENIYVLPYGFVLSIGLCSI
jgi:hypothetical protein